MTQKQFEAGVRDVLERHIEEARKRLRRLEAARSGAADVHRVRVKGHKVPTYWVKSHWRVVAGREKVTA